MTAAEILKYNTGGFNRKPRVISRVESAVALSSRIKPRLEYSDFP